MAFISVILEFMSRFMFDVSPDWSRTDDDLLSREVVDRCGDNCL